MTVSRAGSDFKNVIERISRTVGRYVNNDSVLVRFVSLWVIIASVFTIAWIVSYYLLPQGLLHGGNPAATSEYTGSITSEFLTLFGWNVGISFIAIGANTLRSVNTPLGYVIEVIQAPRYGTVGGLGHLPSAVGHALSPLFPSLLNEVVR